MKTKMCSACNINKPTNEFYKDPRRKDGFYSRCKSCHYKSTKAYNLTDAGRATQKRYLSTEQGRNSHIASVERYNSTDKGKETIRKWKNDNWKKYYDPDSPKTRAHWAVNNAVTRGKLPKANDCICHYCGDKARHYHHYKGYAKKNWMDVFPICPKCHYKVK